VTLSDREQARALEAARELVRQHRAGEPFAALPAPWSVDNEAFAYAVQDHFVGELERQRGTRICGYKIALTTPAMRQMVGFHDSISGRLLQDQVLASGSTVRAADYRHLLIEFEIAFRMSADLPASGSPWNRESILPYVACAHPALEVADDRDADYRDLDGAILTLAADNAWNQGLVLGEPVSAVSAQALFAAAGVATIDGREVGRGTGGDVMGHPLDALAWLANHLRQRGLPLSAGHLVTTGSLVKSKFPMAGSTVGFDIDSLGGVILHVA
jgi:2-keto-4-pentenoate hydratase